MSTRAFLVITAIGLMGQLLPDARAQEIEGVRVETYYVSDANDASDTIGLAAGLPQGSRTYRVFIDLCSDCALRGIYGSEGHPLIIQSTAPLFNHADRDRVYGHLVNNNWLSEGTVALDSWLSMGAATNQRGGVRKDADPDGSLVGGANNDGGSEAVAGGLLANADPEAGTPITTSDGLMPLSGSAMPPSFNPTGETPAVAFGGAAAVNAFSSDSCRIGCATPGTQGPTAENEVLVAQITTAGELTFELNIEVQRGDGSVVRFVARDTLLADDESANGLLRYPPDCGCLDPDYLEYDPSAGCDDGSCQTLIVFGCLDPLACNYDPDANFNVPQLCCYGLDDCNGLDPYLICPGVGIAEAPVDGGIRVAPNPFSDEVIITLGAGTTELVLFDAIGRMVHQSAHATAVAGPVTLNLSALAPGSYVMRAMVAGSASTLLVVKQ